MKEVTPELLNELSEYLQQRERGETTLLSFFYKEVFERELKINCGGCVEDAVSHLKTIVNKNKKPVMENFIWKGKEKANCIIRLNGQLVDINKNTCTDALAEAIEFNSKYAHLVERIKEKEPEEKKTLSEVKESSKTLEVTILTSTEANKGEEIVKKKRGRPRLT